MIDKLYTLIVTAGNGPRVGDGVDQAIVRASQSFPYLSPIRMWQAGAGTYVERAVDLHRRLVQADPFDERNWRALLSANAKRRDKKAIVDREWQRLPDTLRAADTTAKP